MDSTEELILEAAIHLGALSDANRDFSSKAIADGAGVSEYQLFAHFGTKKNLVLQADQRIMERISDFAETLLHGGSLYSDFIDGMLDYFLGHWEETAFLLNYGVGLAHASLDASSLARYHDETIKAAKRILLYYQFADDEQYFLVWSAFVRQLIYGASCIHNGVSPDTPEMRRILKNLIHFGTSYYSERGAVRV